ncbi:hypothetical protein [Massilia sp. YIM B04103]|uniref:hypothetical protein n=1 Tax=Massilia sp. YIM B04103 TaxID=2963106 RepID=UPI00210B6524|nr:hypothetical protein [Massilia sp. YIM B04103]
MKTDLLNSDELPTWFTYPSDFVEQVQAGLGDIGPWQILKGQWLHVRHEGLKKRFPDRDLVPFARRLDDDDVACWDSRQPTHVFIVHDFSAPGWEERAEFSSFQAWMLAAQEDAKDYDD